MKSSRSVFVAILLYRGHQIIPGLYEYVITFELHLLQMPRALERSPKVDELF